jgi:hypothetical protein
MKPIKLELSPDQLTALDNFMSQIDEKYKPTTMEGKAIKSISYSINDKVRGKYLKLQRDFSLFDQSKLITHSLAYHEAFALFQLLNLLLGASPNIYLQIIHDFLHQKLQ